MSNDNYRMTLFEYHSGSDRNFRGP